MGIACNSVVYLCDSYNLLSPPTPQPPNPRPEVHGTHLGCSFSVRVFC